MRYCSAGLPYFQAGHGMKIVKDSILGAEYRLGTPNASTKN